MRDHFYSIKEGFAFKDKTPALKTGTEQAVTALDQLLIDVVEKMTDFEQRQENSRKEGAHQAEKLLAKGEAIRRLAVERRRDRGQSGRASSTGADAEVNDEVGSGCAAMEASSSKRRKCAEVETENLVEVLERSEQRRRELAKIQMDREDRKWEQERRDRAADRARRDEQDSQTRAERAALVRLLDSLVHKLA